MLLGDELGIEVRDALHELALQDASVEVGVGLPEGLLNTLLQAAAGIRERGLQERE